MGGVRGLAPERGTDTHWELRIVRGSGGVDLPLGVAPRDGRALAAASYLGEALRELDDGDAADLAPAVRRAKVVAVPAARARTHIRWAAISAAHRMH